MRAGVGDAKNVSALGIRVMMAERIEGVPVRIGEIAEEIRKRPVCRLADRRLAGIDRNWYCRHKRNYTPGEEERMGSVVQGGLPGEPAPGFVAQWIRNVEASGRSPAKTLIGFCVAWTA